MTEKIKIYLVIFIVLLVVIIGYLAYQKYFIPITLVGNDRDTHGCIGSAGYSWCEVKQKCLRVWEEKCEIATPTKNNLLAEPAAKEIAEKSCIKGGEALSTGTYNPNTKTWWFDANLNATREGCHPACVVSQETKTAEINWRCTGLKLPDNAQCGLENCHGLDIVCGPNPAQVCTEIYMIGDKCRQFAQCGIINGSCQQIDNPQFTTCKTCVENCEKNHQGDSNQSFACESICGE